MHLIGVTGTIGSGKSTVCAIMEELGAVIIDADRLAHDTYRPHTETWYRLVDAFGADILTVDDTVDRGKLAQKAFSSPQSVERLNRIVHPATARLALAAIDTERRKGTRVTVLEATLLIEAGWQRLVDQVWLVKASEDAVLRRLEEQRGMDRSTVLNRLRSQTPAEQKEKSADVVIQNDGTREELERRVRTLWQELVAPWPS
ncbi:MAG: dephospho-CoA kinase [Chloroflexota bacterium]